MRTCRAAWGEEQLLDGGLESLCSCTSSPLTGLSSRGVSCSALSPSCSGCPVKMPKRHGVCRVLHGVGTASPSCLGNRPGAEAWLNPSLELVWSLAPECLLRSWSLVPRQEAGDRLPGDPWGQDHARCWHVPTGFHLQAQPCTLKAGCPSPGSEHDSLWPPGVDTAGFSVMFILSLQVVLRTQAEPVKSA